MSNKNWQIAQAKMLAQHQKNLAKIEREFKEEVTNNIEHIYCATLIILHRRGYTDEQCREVIDEIQQLWYDVADNPDIDIKTLCEEETGFDIRSEGRAKN